MNWYLITTIILGVATVLLGVAWATLWTRGKRLWAGMLELRDDYKKAVADGTITDAEKAEIADDLIDIIDHATTLWQAIRGIIFNIIGIVKKARTP